jgi:ATP-binding cassette subfamily B protein
LSRRAPKASIDPDVRKSWLRRALPLVKAHRGLLITSLVLSFTGLIVQVQIPNLVRLGIDRAIVDREGRLAVYVWGIVGLALLQGLINFLARLYLLRTAYELEYDLRNILYAHLVRMPFGFYDRVQSGELMSRSGSDIRAVQMYLSMGPSILVQCLIAVVAFGLMLSINVPLAIVAMATMPIIGVLGISMRRAIFPVSWLIQARLARLATVVDENIQGVRIVKAFAAEGRQLRTLAESADRVRWAYLQDARIRSRWNPLLDNLPRLGLALVLLIGGIMVIDGHTTVGTIVAFNSYVLMLQPPFRLLGMMIMMGQRASASARRIYEILDQRSDVVDGPDPLELSPLAAENLTKNPQLSPPAAENSRKPPMTVRGHLAFVDVSFSYPNGTPALDRLNLTVAAGETVAVVGGTGSGKSTLGRLAARFYDVTGGRVTVDGVDVREIRLAGLREHVGIVPDEPFLFSLSIHDNIAYGRPEASREAVIEAAVAAGADEFVRELPEGYDAVVGERGYTLSGGQRQRIAIARALLVNPPILVLDDATSAIDVAVEQRIHESLREQMRGRTTLIVAHRLSTISLADRVVLMENGRVIADGTHLSLLETEPRYAEVLAAQEVTA